MCVVVALFVGLFGWMRFRVLLFLVLDCLGVSVWLLWFVDLCFC